MVKFDYVIKDKAGIHARPAGLLVKEAGKFSSTITIKKADKSADAKRIFAIMSLGVKADEQITIEADGADENDAIVAIEEFMKANL